MTKTPCIYAIVRFRPFVETGEFANVGIVMIAPEHRFFGFKLLIARHARVTHFFEQLEGKVYRATMRNLNDELERAHDMMKRAGFDRRLKQNNPAFARALFEEVTRTREAAVQFSEKRAVLALDPATTLNELFQFYVERNFVTKEYQEDVMERGLRTWLRQADLAQRFAPMTLGDDVYHVTFPFVEQGPTEDRPAKAIKPLNLGQGQPSKILEHGGQWIFRVAQLRKRGRLPKEILFTVKADPEPDTARADAVRDIVRELGDQQGIEVAPYDRARVLEFAQPRGQA